MKTLITKFSKYCLAILVLFVVSSFMQVKSEAAWLGVSSLDKYEQPQTEMRAVWVATVYNIDIAAQPGKGENAINTWKNYYLSVLDNAEKNNFNTIIFQIRPCNDAFYPSKYNPWSKYLSPDGTDPGWDPLEWMLEVTHARGMEYHAWLNPYRATVGSSIKLTEEDPVTNIAKITDIDRTALNRYKEENFAQLREQNPGMENPVLETGEELYHNVVLGTENLFVLNPASEKVRTHIENTIAEIIDNYDIDGIHFDDYFYPNDCAYSGSNVELKGRTYSCEPEVDYNDYKQYMAECSETGEEVLSVYDWRRENVNKLIKGLSDLIRTKNAAKDVKCAFGISPAARWAPSKESCSSEPYRGAEGGMYGSCNDYYSYSDLFADTYKWAKEEWIDYLTPQNYTNLAGAYPEIAKWWSNALQGSKTKLYMGTAIYQVKDNWGDSGTSEIFYQLRYNQTYDLRIDGYFFYNYKSMLSGKPANGMNAIRNYAWKYDTLTPLYDAYTYEKTVKEHATVKSLEIDDEGVVTLYVNPVEGAKGYGVMGFANDDMSMDFYDFNKNGKDLELNPNTPMTFKYDPNMIYCLVTYDNDNTIYPSTALIDFKINEKPQVTVNIDKAEYELNEKAKVTVSVTDDDATQNLTIMYASKGTNFVSIVSNKEMSNNSYTHEIELNEATSNGVIKVIINDGTNTVEETVVLKVNAPAPTVTIGEVTDVKVGDNVIFDVMVEGFEGSFDYEVYVTTDGENYELVQSDSSSSELFAAEISTEEESENCKIKVVVKYGKHIVEAYSNEFKVETASGSQGGGSNCNMGSMFIQFFTAIALLTIVLRKTRR